MDIKQLWKAALLFMLLFCLCITVSCAGEREVVLETASVEDGEGNVMESGKIYPIPEVLIFRSAASETATGSEVTLEATITPSSAENQLVDWSVTWQDPESEFAAGKTVTDYVTVTPTSDGALTAKVRCLTPFEGTILVKVVTREGGYSAACAVSFVGKPSELTVMPTVNAENGFYNLKAGTTYTWDIALSNAWEQVGSEFCDFEVTSVGVGNVIIAAREVFITGLPESSDNWLADTEHSVPIDEIQINCADETFGIATLDWEPSGGKYEFLSVSISDGKLVLSAKATIESYMSGNWRNVLGGEARFMFKEFENGVEPYYNVTVREKTSGVSQTIKIHVRSTVNGLSLNTDRIE